MKVLLCQDIENLGWIGDVVEVRDGYARNYLLPQKMATTPTETNVRALAEAKTRAAEHRKLLRSQQEQLAQVLDGVQCDIIATANEQGHLFGSVSARDIAEDLRSKGFAVTDEMIRLDEHIKQVGTYTVTVKTGADITAEVSVAVNPQEKTVESDKRQNEE